MPGSVSRRLYLLLDALENFDISAQPLVSRDIKFSSPSRSKYNRQETPAVIVFYIYGVFDSGRCMCTCTGYFPNHKSRSSRNVILIEKWAS